MYHEHPLKILKNSFKNIWLLVFPLLRGLKTMRLDFDVLYAWIKGTWFDLLVLLLILGFGYLRWSFTWFRFGSDEVSLMSGIFVKRETSIPYENISAVTSEHSFYLRPFKAVRINIDTCAGVMKKSDMSLIVRISDMRRFNRSIPTVIHAKIGKPFELKPKWFSIVFFSFVFSSSLSGAVYISAFFFQFGRISKELMENELRSALDAITGQVAANFALSVPPAAVFLGILIITTWLLSFTANILRYAGFTMKKDNRFIEVKMGAATRRHFRIITPKINYIDMRQSFIMKIFRKTSLNISCSGYGNQKNELPVLLPVLSRRQANSAMDILDFGKRIGKRTFSSDRSALITFTGIPVCIAGLVPLAASLIMRLVPSVSDFTVFFAVMVEIPVIWMIVIRIIALFTSGISFEDSFICVRYSRFFSFHTVLADKKKLVKVQIVQNPVQKKIGRCRMDFYFSSEYPKKNKLYGMNIKNAEKILAMLGCSYGTLS